MQVDYKSPNMERLGLRKTLDFMAGKLSIVEVVTDASTSIKAMLGNYTIVEECCITHHSVQLRSMRLSSYFPLSGHFAQVEEGFG